MQWSVRINEAYQRPKIRYGAQPTCASAHASIQAHDNTPPCPLRF